MNNVNNEKRRRENWCGKSGAFPPETMRSPVRREKRTQFAKASRNCAGLLIATVSNANNNHDVKPPSVWF